MKPVLWCLLFSCVVRKEGGSNKPVRLRVVVPQSSSSYYEAFLEKLVALFEVPLQLVRESQVGLQRRGQVWYGKKRPYIMSALESHDADIDDAVVDSGDG